VKLEGQVAVVTGAGSGIGRAIAQRFAEEGARVVVNDVHADAAEATVKALPSDRGRALVGDVADPARVRAMFEEVDRAFGRLDVLVNNAGIAEGAPGERERVTKRSEQRLTELLSGQEVTTHLDVTQQMSDESWERVLGVHLFGTFYCTREALKIMSRANRGAIVNMSSVAALMGLESVPHYSAAKGGILAFTRAVAREVASRNIRVNAICPGYIDTPMTAPISPLLRRATLARTPLSRMGQPEDVAATALFLVSDDGAYYTGQWLSPNGGLFTG
jgi:3-oxoacyl-[acyl-carrier protein] reductase